MEGIEIRRLSISDMDQVFKFLKEDYCTREPAKVHLRVPVDEYLTRSKPSVEGCLKAGASYGAFDKSNGLLCGTSFNDLGINAQPPNEDHPYSQNMKQLVKLYQANGMREYIASRGTKNYTEIRSLCVKDGYARRGIGTRLCEMSIEAAKEKACEYVVMVCLGAHSRKIADRLGFKLIQEVFYKDYVDPLTGKMVMKDIPEPHCSFTLHSLDL